MNKQGKFSIHYLALCLVSSGLSFTVQAASYADTVLLNGYVYTVDKHDSVAHAVAIKGGRIIYVGSDAGSKPYISHSTRVIDLAGRMLMPGLIDAHIHPLTGGAGMLKCNLEYQPMTIAQMQARIGKCLADSSGKSSADWLEVVNWDRQAMNKLDRDPSAADLDQITTDRPIVVTSIDNHSRLNNSIALDRAQITAQTPDPAGGRIGKDANGKLTGLLEDGAVMLSDKAIPLPDAQQRLTYAAVALDMLRRQGVTTFMAALSDEDEVSTFATLSRQGKLTARGEFAIKIDPKEAANPVAAVDAVKMIAKRYSRPLVEQPGIQVHNIKLWLDGVLQAPAQTAGLLQPYHTNHGSEQQPDWRPGQSKGENYFKTDELNKLVLEAGRQGFDIHMHAIGDATVRQALDAIEYARQHCAHCDARPSIAHAELVDPADYQRFAQLHAIANMQFQWQQRAPYSVEAVKEQLGTERYSRMEPEGYLKHAGTRIAYGSDWPVDPMAYFYNLRVGVTGRGDPTHPAGFGPEYAGRINEVPLLERQDVLRAITMNAAYQLRLEKHVGSIEAGKFADLIVLDTNFMQAPVDKLAYTQVKLTMLGGHIVWADKDFSAIAED